jgi:hypothetical protein
MNRPAGVTIIAALDFLDAILAILSICGTVGFAIWWLLLVTYFDSPSKRSNERASAVIFAVAVLLIIYGCINMLLGWGMLKQKAWARIAQIVLATVTILLTLVLLVWCIVVAQIPLTKVALTLPKYSLFGLYPLTIRACVDLAILLYLKQRRVKVAFETPLARLA